MSSPKEVALYNPNHTAHHPPFEIWNGQPDKHQEVPARAENILAALQRSSIYTLREVTASLSPALIDLIHTPDYLAFLASMEHDLQFDEGNGNDGYRYPSVFNLKDGVTPPTNPLAKLGYYSFDMYTPVTKTTYESAMQSANLARQLAEDIHSQVYQVGYALCRPPGHHAESAQMGGYCYINNAAVAADYFSQFGYVSVLDVDFHHGNGTQNIFYHRGEVQTVSLHADPTWKFPHMAGYESEKGVGEGEGTNHNFVLQQGTTNEQFQDTLLRALEQISNFNSDYLVVSFGADTFVGDPIGGFALTTDYFGTMGETINQLGLPTAIVQEGGYNTEELGLNVVTFLQGFKR